MADSHRIYLRPKMSKMDNWANGSFRMIAQDVEDVIKDFDDEWKKALEETTTLPAGTVQTDPSDKGKDKVGSKKKDTVEVPPPAQKRKDTAEVPPPAQRKKDAVEVPPEAQKRKKSKASKPTIETALKEDGYELIAARLQDTMRDSF